MDNTQLSTAVKNKAARKKRLAVEAYWHGELSLIQKLYSDLGVAGVAANEATLLINEVRQRVLVQGWAVLPIINAFKSPNLDAALEAAELSELMGNINRVLELASFVNVEPEQQQE